MTVLAEPFVTRKCGHRVPKGTNTCPFCTPPRLDAEPLREVLQVRATRDGRERVSFEIASRLGMRFETVDQHIRRILAGEVRTVNFRTADEYTVALGGVMPASLWGDAWNDASPIEIYGDEDLGVI